MSGVYTAPRDADGLNLPTGSHHMDEPVLRRAGVAGGGGETQELEPGSFDAREGLSRCPPKVVGGMCYRGGLGGHC